MEADEGVVTAHLRQLRVRNLRQSSISNRRYVLLRLTEWVDGPILYLTAAQLKAWQESRTDKVSPATVRMEMTSVREFYKWCIKEGLRGDSPVDGLDMPRVPRGRPRPMPDIELARAIEAAEPRIAAILCLAAFAGLRACEIARLDWAEVSFDDNAGELTVVDGKGGHGRVVPMSRVLADALRVLPGPRHGPVIRQLNGHAGHNKPHRISQLANTFLHDPALGVEQTLHQGRHRFATAAYATCRDIRSVQEMMGHASPVTTSIYTLTSSDVARRAVEGASHLNVA